MEPDSPIRMTPMSAIDQAPGDGRAVVILSSASRAKSGFSSIPTHRRCKRSAVTAVVPDPINGSSTIPGSVPSWCVHVAARANRVAVSPKRRKARVCGLLQVMQRASGTPAWMQRVAKGSGKVA